MNGLLVVERQPDEWLGLNEFVPATLEQMADMVDGRVSYISRTQLNKLDSVAQIRIAYTPVQLMAVDPNNTTVKFLGIGEAYTDCLQIDASSLYNIADIDEIFYECIEGAFAHWLQCLEMNASVGMHVFEPSIDIKRQLVDTYPVGVCYEMIDEQAVMTFHFLAVIDKKLVPETFTELYGECHMVVNNGIPDPVAVLEDDFVTEVVVSHNALLFNHLARTAFINGLGMHY